jgi:hypothetical protein
VRRSRKRENSGRDTSFPKNRSGTTNSEFALSKILLMKQIEIINKD